MTVKNECFTILAELAKTNDLRDNRCKSLRKYELPRSPLAALFHLQRMMWRFIQIDNSHTYLSVMPLLVIHNIFH